MTTLLNLLLSVKHFLQKICLRCHSPDYYPQYTATPNRPRREAGADGRDRHVSVGLGGEPNSQISITPCLRIEVFAFKSLL